MSITKYINYFLVSPITKADKIWLSTFLSTNKGLSRQIVSQEILSLYNMLNGIVFQKNPYLFGMLDNTLPQNWVQQVDNKSLLVIPFSRILISAICQMHLETDYEINIIINPKSKLPFIEKLNQLEKVSIITQSQALSLLTEKDFDDAPSILISCPELNPTNLKSGHLVNLGGYKYCFSMFEALLSIKGGMKLKSFTYQHNQLKFEHYTNNDQKDGSHNVNNINDFIYDCIESIIIKDEVTVFSWEDIKQHSVEQLSLGEINMINRIEGLILYNQEIHDENSKDLEPLMQNLKELKTKAYRISGFVS